MPYTKTIWSDRAVQYPRRYKDQNNVQYTFTPDEGTVTNAGISITATRMNNIENQIETLTNQAETLYRDVLTANASSVTITIPSGYPDLVIKIAAVGTASSSININFNNDTTGANYSYIFRLPSSGMSLQSSMGYIGLEGVVANGTVGIANVSIANITGKTKQVMFNTANFDGGYTTTYGTGKWLGTAEISTIKLTASFGIGTRIIVTGIK